MRIHRHHLAVALLLLAACSKESTPPAPSATAPPASTAPATVPPSAPAAAAPQRDRVFSQEELDQMVAPIALYPDSLLAQVLMAATYPGNVADAVAWSKANPNAKGDDAVKQVASQPWDPSVQSLVAFPQALATLGQDPAWVQRLGDAFLAQPDDVMDAVQRLRRQAQAAGNLESNQYQKVTVQPAAAAPESAPAPAQGGTTVVETASSPTIIIEPSNPETVYVPSYNPTTVYGTWPYPSYPPAYYPPPVGYYAGSALMTGLAFGTGIAITNALWGDCDWGSNDIDIDVNRYNNINSNRQLNVNDNTWRHNAANRQGVPYRDRASREQFGRQLDGSAQRASFRGEDASRTQARDRARQSMERAGVERPGAGNLSARDRAGQVDRDLRNDPQARDRLQGADRDQARDRAQAATRDRPQGQSRDQARDRAQATARDRTQGQSRDQARDRAQATTRDHQARDRAQASQRDGQRAQQQRQHTQQQRNAPARQQARTQHAAQQGPRDNAFAGARNPQQSRAQTDRGRASHASAQRPQAQRSASAGRQVQRQSRPPQRQAGGRRH